jgi:hypothetical protein
LLTQAFALFFALFDGSDEGLQHFLTSPFSFFVF